MGHTKCECEGFSERHRVAAGSQWKEPHCRRDYSFTPRKITKRKRLQGTACDSFRRLGQSGSRGKSHRDLGPIAANSASAYANRDTLRLASPNGQAWYEALDAPASARVAIYSFRSLSPNSEVSLWILVLVLCFPNRPRRRSRPRFCDCDQSRNR